jgi:hypothetical protein
MITVRNLAVGLVFLAGFALQDGAPGQEPSAPAPADQFAAVPQGVEVMTRGPVHEAFATPAGEPKATAIVTKRPPAPLEEMPPDQRPEGDVVWIAGYWGWDDDHKDYLWVSGCWRQKPPNKDWVAGYWREADQGWQWVPGFWHDAATQGNGRQIAYYPEPPAPPQVAPPPERPAPDTFYVPGSWYWNGERYVWRSGYWARIQPGYVWVPAHYRWTPYGYVYVGGYWDLAVTRRGMLYAPVVVDPVVVRAGFVYTPVYAVPDVVVVDTLFVGPRGCCYYYGDYYGPRYAALGFESCVVYSRRHYDAIIVYECYEHRGEPRWLDARVELCYARDRGLAPLPPRTLAQQLARRDAHFLMVAPAARVAAARGQRIVRLERAERVEAMRHAALVRETALAERRRAETPVAAGARLTAPRVATVNVPATHAPGNPVIPRNPITLGQRPALPAAGQLKAPGPFGSGGPPPLRPGLVPYGHPGLPNATHDALGRPLPPRPAPPPARESERKERKTQDSH